MSQLSISGESLAQAQERIGRRATTNSMVTTAKIGFWAATLTAISSVLYGIAVISTLIFNLSNLSSAPEQGWTGIDAFLASFHPIQMLAVIPSLILVPAFTTLMVSIHAYASEEKKVWSLLGLAFTLIYASMAAMNYMIQLFPVWRSINNGETDGLAMFVLGNPHSIFWALAYAYIFMNLAMLFSAQVFSGDRLQNRIRRLFLLNGASGLITLVSAFLDSYQFYLLGSLLVWCPIFTAAAVATTVLFIRIVRSYN